MKIGEIRLFAGTFAPAGWAFCEGQTFSISQSYELFNEIGTTYGGDGQETFMLPDLRDRAAVQSTQSIPTGSTGAFPGKAADQSSPKGALRVSYIIAVEGFPMDDAYIGEIRPFAGNVVPAGWQACEGQTLSIAQNTALFSILGSVYGQTGNPQTFNLPDLRGKVALHRPEEEDLGKELGARSLSPSGQNRTHLAVRFCICVSGAVFPPRG